MTSAPAEPATEPLPFRYVGGDPAVDLVNTVDWTSAGLASERLSTFERLAEWAQGAGTLTGELAEALLRQARRRPADARHALEQARRLRLTLQRLFSAIAAGRPLSAPARELNEWLREALAHLELAPARGAEGHPAGGALEWEWCDGETDLESPLWPVVWAAARLVASDEAARIRVCADPECGWMYVDRSRNGLRRWCQMETCGTKAKTRRRRLRK